MNSSSYPESAFRLHGQEVSVVGDKVQDVLVYVGERVEDALLLQPLFTQQTAPRNEQYVELTVRLQLVLAVQETHL